MNKVDIGEYNTLVNEYNELYKENKELKKQYCERTDCGGRLGNSKKVEELIKENEKLNHYKLLYQKVKERNDKAIEITHKILMNSADNRMICTEEEEYFDWLDSEMLELEKILKSNNETN